MLMFFLEITLCNWNLFPLKAILGKPINAVRKIFVIKRILHELKKSVNKLHL